jgi:hypothetical protein
VRDNYVVIPHACFQRGPDFWAGPVRHGLFVLSGFMALKLVSSVSSSYTIGHQYERAVPHQDYGGDLGYIREIE